MLKSKPMLLGSLKGTIYDFEVSGDVLPMHTHDETNVHISIVARGSFTVSGPSWKKTLNTGDVVDWLPDQSHEFVALESSSRLVNIIKA